MNLQTRGHLAAIFTILLWGATFISTKILLEGLSPIEILVGRFLMGYFALWVMAPHWISPRSFREEAYFIGAGATGICLYYLLENIALTYSFASNVGIMVSTAPFFTALLAPAFSHGKEKVPRRFYFGFVVALCGISLITLSGDTLSFSPFGDFLALSAAVVWAVYSHFLDKIFSLDYPTIPATRRIFGYGILFMLPVFFGTGDMGHLAVMFEPLYLGNMLFLGFGASACCFATWNYAVKIMGPVKSGVYIYATPVVTAILAILILHEPFTWMMAIGMGLTILGLVLSQ